MKNKTPTNLTKSIYGTTDCFGCGVCAASCPLKIIDIVYNDSGFYVPQLNAPDDCINCGICLSVCDYAQEHKNKQDNHVVGSYAAWSSDTEVRSKCSSGGVAYEISRQLIAQGYKNCGVRYNTETQRVEHYIATSIAELEESVGSKYLQSYTASAFSTITKGEMHVIFGTPCQIASLRLYLKKKRLDQNVYLIDFFCHGVPSNLMWQKYLSEITTSNKIETPSWRSKKTGWHDSWAISFKHKQGSDTESDKHFSLCSQSDMFYKMFLSDCCLGKACYEQCRFKKTNSEADIRLGDLWGEKYAHDEAGVSGVITLTEKGEKLFLSLKNVEYIPESIDVVLESQMKKNPKRRWYVDALIANLKTKKSLLSIYNKFVRADFFLRYPYNLVKRIVGRIVRTFK